MRQSVSNEKQKLDVCKPRVLVQWGCSPHPQAYVFHHPWITHGASPPIPVKKLQNTVSPIFFYGVILVVIDK